ncbi:Aldolase [Mycena sanguinolenta]|uniref:Aldolase n=1 Tax=Mycena sanguinolenta TaxID=230812 RepID=A0A8H6ZDS3_9AGAR|nr:Aldolase [Mycena sanguinolenta]
MSLLTQIREMLTVDVNSMDLDVVARHSTAQKFCDMTSNQAIVHGQASLPTRRNLLEAAIEYVRKTPPQEGEEFEQAVVDVLTVLLAKEVYPYLTGNVHAQTSPSAAYDTEKTVKHARKLVDLFTNHGIPTERVCIKIPATPESLLACRELQASGIQTLATCLFSFPQAVAASQAGCTYVAPYFNELRVHFQPAVWVKYADPKTQHPMSSVILNIVHAFRELKSKTLVMPARFVYPSSAVFNTSSCCPLSIVIALVSLSPNHLTLSAGVLDALSALPSLEPEAFMPPAVSAFPSIKGDYLADEGALLLKALAEEHEVQRKLADALAIFGEKEAETRQLVKALIADK